MDTATREIVQLEKAARRQARENERQRQLAEAQQAWQLEWDKRRVVYSVEVAAKYAAERLNVEPGKWGSEGRVRRVCNYSGPHHGFLCLFHRRKRVTLVEIPGARGGCPHCDKYYNRNRPHRTFDGLSHRSLYLGSNGKIYRVGHTKIFEAKLMDRDNAKDIRTLVPKLNAMA
ncbi:MAG: hypothetical protein JWM00_349 [Candidatus Saccharibacteria bacterium]|nr:hypothetical protein [Candidatus Saccharibacteria bacterium]